MIISQLERAVSGAGRVVFYGMKMYLACGLMLKAKLLPLIIEFVVFLNHLGVVHL